MLSRARGCREIVFDVLLAKNQKIIHNVTILNCKFQKVFSGVDITAFRRIASGMHTNIVAL